MNNKVIETNHLSKIYVMGGEEIKAVDNVDLVITKGEFISIMGPSGSGKTTLLNLIGCIDRPTSGTILFEGQDISKLKESQLDQLRLRKAGFVFQNFNLIPVLTALENVMLPMEMAGVARKEQIKRATELLAWVGLPKRIHHKPRELSAGENQRVGIARALANNPTILFADEPTGNLDSRIAQEIALLFKRVNSDYGTSIIIVTHNPGIAEIATRYLKMMDGHFV